MDNRPVLVAMKKEELEDLLNQAALVGAQAAAEITQREMEKNNQEKRDRRLHNTKLLLSHYRDFKAHCTKSVYDSRMAGQNADLMEMLMEMKDDAVILESIQRTVVRTEIILEHIDRMMSVFRSYAEQGGDMEKRQYSVVYGYYIASPKKSIQDLSEEFKVSKVTVHKDLKFAEEKLSILFFGMDGLRIA